MKTLTNTWQPLSEEITISRKIKFINCDTRDFHIILSTKYPTTYEDFRQKLNETDYTKYLVHKDTIISFLSDLKQKTGGDGDWRHLELQSMYWLKYIWFVRYDKENFILTTREGKFFSPEQIISEIDWTDPYIMTE